MKLKEAIQKIEEGCSIRFEDWPQNTVVKKVQLEDGSTLKVCELQSKKYKYNAAILNSYWYIAGVKDPMIFSDVLEHLQAGKIAFLKDWRDGQYISLVNGELKYWSYKPLDEFIIPANDLLSEKWELVS